MSIDICFDAARNAAGSPPRRKFDQKVQLTKQVKAKLLKPGAEDGMCGGVCLAYNGLLKAGTSIFTLDASSPNALWQYIKRAQAEVEAPTMEACNFEMSGEAFGLKVEARAISFKCPVSTALSTWVRNRPGFYLVGMPNHYCAAVHAANAFSFFDPNAGEVLFPKADGGQFSQFVDTYLATPEIAKQYYLIASYKVYLTAYK
jgi:hypothetical protein